MNKNIFKFIVIIFFFKINIYAQSDTCNTKQIFFRHSFSYNLIGLTILDTRLSYRYRFRNNTSIIAEVSHKEGGKSHNEKDLIYVPFLNLFTASNYTGNVGSRTDISLRFQYEMGNNRRRLNISPGIFYRYIKKDSVYLDKSGEVEKSKDIIMYSEESHSIGLISQFSFEFGVLLLKSFQIYVEPYYRGLLLFPVKIDKVQYGYEDIYDQWIEYNPPETMEAYPYIYSHIGLNIGIRF